MTRPELEELGTKETIDPRKVWPDETRDFTPWLAENIERLEYDVPVVGSDLEVDEIESNVGPYSADILATDETDRNIIIENQLSETDHTHLGQTLVYAIGLDADLAIWIAQAFDEEHLDVLRWLNQNAEGVRFIGVEVDVFQIEDSPLTPHFQTVESPEHLSGEVSKRSPTEKGQLDFWETFEEFANERNYGNLAGGRARGKAAYHPVNTSWGELRFSANTRDNVLYCAMRIVDENASFRGLGGKQDKLTERVVNKIIDHNVSTGDINWESRDDVKRDRIKIDKPGVFTLEDTEEWDTYFEWLLDIGNAFHKVYVTELEQTSGRSAL